MFDVTLSADRVSGHSADLRWTGVPMPHQKYVNLYRVLYQEAEHNAVPGADHRLNSVETKSVFRDAKLDTEKGLRLRGLDLDTKYKVWLEVYLRNGKVFQSNVLEVETADTMDAIDQRGKTLRLAQLVACLAPKSGFRNGIPYRVSRPP